MKIKRVPKRPMIWTGDLPCKHFQSKPVDLTIEFEMDTVKMLDDLDNLWKKFETAFWKRFIPLMNGEIDKVTKQVVAWDNEFESWTPQEQAAANGELATLTKGMGVHIKAESVRFAGEAFAETMRGVDNSVAKAKVFAVVKVTWTIAAAVAKVATVVGAITLPVQLLKAKKELQTAQATFATEWGNLQSKAETVQHSALSVGQAFPGLKLAGDDAKLRKAAIEKLRAAGKKLKEDVDAMNVHIAAARKSLTEQDAKIAAMEKEMASGKVKADVAAANIKAWRTARGQCVAQLEFAAQAKQWAATAESELEAAALEDPTKFMTAVRQVNSAADKLLKVEDTIEKGDTIVKAIEALEKLVG